MHVVRTSILTIFMAIFLLVSYLPMLASSKPLALKITDRNLSRYFYGKAQEAARSPRSKLESCMKENINLFI